MPSVRAFVARFFPNLLSSPLPLSNVERGVNSPLSIYGEGPGVRKIIPSFIAQPVCRVSHGRLCRLISDRQQSD